MRPRRSRQVLSARIQRIAAAVTCGLLLAIAGPAAAMIPPLAGRPGPLRTDARLATAARTAAPAYFHTLKPGTKLPSAAQCASWVLARPAAENKGVNRRFNAATGHQVGQAQDYIAKVRRYLREKIWTTKNFQQP
jgi:hypothetical protein